jgi:hypothetical protein
MNGKIRKVWTDEDEGECESKFGGGYTALFPLIGQEVMTPRGPGRLLMVFARQCEIWSRVKGDLTFRVKPDQIRTMSAQQLVTHQAQEATDRYMEERELKHKEQRRLAKEKRARPEAMVALPRENCWHCQGAGLCSCIWCWPQNHMLDSPACAKCQKAHRIISKDNPEAHRRISAQSPSGPAEAHQRSIAYKNIFSRF